MRVSINGRVWGASKKSLENAMKLRESQLSRHLKPTQIMLKRKAFFIAIFYIYCHFLFFCILHHFYVQFCFVKFCSTLKLILDPPLYIASKFFIRRANNLPEFNCTIQRMTANWSGTTVPIQGKIFISLMVQEVDVSCNYKVITE